MAKTEKPVITITTATKLSAEQLKTVTKLLSTKMGAVEVEQVVDSSVIGGIKLSIGGQSFDATIAGKLEKLESQLPEAVVTTAVPLTASQRAELTAGIEKKYGNIKLVEKIDASVLGGLKLLVGSKEINATIHGKVLQLKEQLLQNM